MNTSSSVSGARGSFVAVRGFPLRTAKEEGSILTGRGAAVRAEQNGGWPHPFGRKDRRTFASVSSAPDLSTIKWGSLRETGAPS